MFVTLSFQLFKTLSVSQHLANPGFIAPANSGLPQTINAIYRTMFIVN